MKTKKAVAKKEAVPVEISGKRSGKPQEQHRINECAMLTTLNLSRWRAAVVDDEISREVAVKHNSREDMGRYKKFLMDDAPMEPIRAACRAARSEHNRLTLPWLDEGSRILSSVGYMTYTEKMRKAEEVYWKAVKGFLPHYRVHVARIKAMQNSLFKESDYPSEQQIANKFGFRLIITPIPDFEDWRVNLADAEVSRLRQQGQCDLQAQLKTSTQDIWRRLQKVINHMVESLNEYTVGKDGKVQNSFRDTLVTNISDVLEIVPILNVTGDPDIDRFSSRIKQELVQYDPETLRSDERVRKNVAHRAEEIMAKMSSFLS